MVVRVVRVVRLIGHGYSGDSAMARRAFDGEGHYVRLACPYTLRGVCAAVCRDSVRLVATAEGQGDADDAFASYCHAVACIKAYRRAAVVIGRLVAAATRVEYHTGGFIYCCRHFVQLLGISIAGFRGSPFHGFLSSIG